MPASTRSSTRQNTFVSNINAAVTPTISIHRADGTTFNVLRTPPNNNKKWSKTDERTLIRLCRHTEMTPDLMAVTLGRTEEAIRYRLANIMHEHLDGRTDNASIKEVSNWLLPNH
jgi:hypothetical protein